MNKSNFFLTSIVLMILLACSELSVNVDRADEVIEDTTVPEVIPVEIFAEQFKWTIRYSGENNQLGKFDYKLTNEENPLGLMTTESIETRLVELENELRTIDSMSLHMEVTIEFMEKHRRKERTVRLLRQMRDKHISSIDQFAQDDLIITDTMVLCVDQEYEFHFRSKDVIHEAYFPYFRTQSMKTVPGMMTRFKFKPKETTIERQEKEKNDQFQFILKCNKVCGAGHDSMQMVVRVVEKDEYLTWIASNESRLFKNRTRN